MRHLTAHAYPQRKLFQSGHALLELAICAGVLVMFLAGIFQFGYTFYLYNRLVTVVGNGARYAAQRTYRAASQQDIEHGNAAIRNMVVYGDPQPTPESQPLLPNLNARQVEVSWVKAGGAPSAVDLTVRNYRVDAVFRSFTFDGRPSVEFPYVGRYAPLEREP
jgi:hypothetical protein